MCVYWIISLYIFFFVKKITLRNALRFKQPSNSTVTTGLKLCDQETKTTGDCTARYRGNSAADATVNCWPMGGFLVSFWNVVGAQCTTQHKRDMWLWQHNKLTAYDTMYAACNTHMAQVVGSVFQAVRKSLRESNAHKHADRYKKWRRTLRIS